MNEPTALTIGLIIGGFLVFALAWWANKRNNEVNDYLDEVVQILRDNNCPLWDFNIAVNHFHRNNEAWRAAEHIMSIYDNTPKEEERSRVRLIEEGKCNERG